MELRTDKIAAFIENNTGCSSFEIKEVVQDLWSGYGKIVRIELKGAEFPSVILKHVDLEAVSNHPRGWNTDRSHQRKLRSYEIEWKWYSEFAIRNRSDIKMPMLLGQEESSEDRLLLLEDLDASGYPIRKTQVNLAEVKSCLTWLAKFHAHYMGSTAEGLWETGTYWHLATRPDELDVMTQGELKDKAQEIDRKLSETNFSTLVHGDAKLANFCFSKEGEVAAVDFQYVGGGCGMKDVAYFMTSCLSSDDCFQYEDVLLDHYFQTLRSDLPKFIDGKDLEQEWRRLYCYAWTDFVRFLEGWSPGHFKLNTYSKFMVNKVL